MVGKVSFMAPEMSDSKKKTSKVDIYSLGVVFIFLWTKSFIITKSDGKTEYIQTYVFKDKEFDIRDVPHIFN